MRLFRSAPGEHPTTMMLRNLELGRFDEAYKALKRYRDTPPPPPHALWRLGRWLAEHDRPKQAKLAFKLFLDLYPNHGDKPAVLRDLALAHKALGEHEEAIAVAEDAKAMKEAVGRKP
jgi:tetratricopeptide (TPR) repeat protein